MDLHRERVLLVAAHVDIVHEVEHVFVCVGAGAVKSSFTFAFDCRVSLIEARLYKNLDSFIVMHTNLLALGSPINTAIWKSVSFSYHYLFPWSM